MIDTEAVMTAVAIVTVIGLEIFTWAIIAWFGFRWASKRGDKHGDEEQ